MKTRLWVIGIVLVGCAAAIACVTYSYPPISHGSVAPTVAPAAGSDEPFYDDLAPYGRWINVSGPGWVWSPYNVQAGWRPYQVGHWVFTDYGWTWASDEEFGSVVYHYGRWHQDPRYGWLWVPGTEWGPAWVAWHEGGGYVGWAPLPWQVSFRAEVGLDWGGVNISIEPSRWCFVNARYLVDPGLRGRIEPSSRNVTLVRVTRNITNYTFVDNRIVNEGVRVEAIGRAVGHTIPRYRVAQADSPEVSRGGKVRGEEFVVFRPDPSRGRGSQGRGVPPGHDELHHPRDFRQMGSQPEPAPAAGQPPTAPAGQPPTAQAGQPAPATEQPAANPAPPARGQSEPPARARGRKFFESMMQKETPRHVPQAAPPSQPAAPAQPGAPGQPAATAPAAGTQASTPPAGDQHGATTPPANQAPAKGQPAKGRGRGPKDDASKRGKPKPEAPKSDGSDADKAKTEKPNSDH